MTAWDGFDILYPVSGFLVGTLVGMTGIGGGSLMTPLLILLFGVQPTVAVGTDLLYAAVTKSMGTIAHGIINTIEWRIVGLLAAGSVPATLLTLWWLSETSLDNEEIGSLITVVIGTALLLTSVSLILRSYIRAFSFEHFGDLAAKRRNSATVFTGFVLGVLVSATSVGAGAIGVVLLILLYPKLPMPRIVGSDIAHAVPLTLIAGIGHWQLGSVDWVLLLMLLMGSVPGVLFGTVLAARVPEVAIRYTLAVVLAVVSIRLLVAR
jgi:uncharacterized membrane protein YfcA